MFTTGFVGLALYLTFFGMALLRSAFDLAILDSRSKRRADAPGDDAVLQRRRPGAVRGHGGSRADVPRTTRPVSHQRPRQGPMALRATQPGGYLPRARRHLVLLAVLVAAELRLGQQCRLRMACPSRPNRRSSFETTGHPRPSDRWSPLPHLLPRHGGTSSAPTRLLRIRLSTGSQLSDQEILDRLSVTAIPNTRILVVHVEMRGARMASAAVAGAADAYLAERTRLTTIYREGQIGHLGKRSDSLSAALRARDRLPDTRREESRRWRWSPDCRQARAWRPSATGC